jgi:hypothetical protein
VGRVRAISAVRHQHPIGGVHDECGAYLESSLQKWR